MRKLGALETAVMQHLWTAARPLLVREVLDEVNSGGRDKALAYTTVMTVLDNLHRKGLVDREKDGRAFRYAPTMSREEHTAELMDGVLSGSTDRGSALLYFVERMSSEELADLREALARLTDPGERA